ncbi:MAG TPA: hypothetical protein VGM05_12075 [Planctomycetaceae bacterium]
MPVTMLGMDGMRYGISVETGSPIAVIATAGAGVALIALCGWLTVRIVNRRERWAKWTAAALAGVVLLYPLSFGPATWLVLGDHVPEWFLRPIENFYWPLLLISVHAPEPAGNVLVWYTKLWLPDS